MKVIIAGSRNFNDYQLLKDKCDYLLSKTKCIEIVSGTAKGADLLGERYARENKYKLHKFPADWNLHGKKAGVIRNKEMAMFADALIAFWDGKSRGAKNMIEEAKSRGLKVKVFYF